MLLCVSRGEPFFPGELSAVQACRPDIKASEERVGRWSGRQPAEEGEDGMRERMVAAVIWSAGIVTACGVRALVAYWWGSN